MDQSKPPIPPSESHLRSACERTPADIDPVPAQLDEPVAVARQSRPGRIRNGSSDGPSVAVYYRNEQEVREGFLIALREMGIAVIERKPAEPPHRERKAVNTHASSNLNDQEN